LAQQQTGTPRLDDLRAHDQFDGGLGENAVTRAKVSDPPPSG